MLLKCKSIALYVVVMTLACGVQAAVITETLDLDQPDPAWNPSFNLSGLSAEAVFKLDTSNPDQLIIEFKNTSTGAPVGFDSSDQILTSISFDLGAAGENVGDPLITGGSVVVGAGSVSVNFDNVGGVQLTAGDDCSGEWGYGNGGTTNLLSNFVSVNTAGTAARFATGASDNLDQNANLNGPQGGLVSDPIQVALGGLGAIQDSVVITLDLDSDLTDLDFLNSNGVVVEFGSDQGFVVVPEPSTMAVACLGGLLSLFSARRRRRLS